MTESIGAMESKKQAQPRIQALFLWEASMVFDSMGMEKIATRVDIGWVVLAAAGNTLFLSKLEVNQIWISTTE